MTVDLVIGKTNDLVASLLQPRCATLVVFNLYAVAVSVDLNHQFVRNTTEIRDERSNRVLTPEPQSVKLFAPEPRPKPSLGWGLFSAQFPGPLLNSLGRAPTLALGHSAISSRPPSSSPRLTGGGQTPSPVATGEGRGGRQVGCHSSPQFGCSQHPIPQPRHVQRCEGLALEDDLLCGWAVLLEVIRHVHPADLAVGGADDEHHRVGLG
jgi:hypothetical protein